MHVQARALDIWMNGEPVGVWYASRNGVPVLQYHAEWLQSPRGRPLSISLPFVPGNQPHRGERVVSWFDNLLPDSAAIRERIRTRFKTGSVSTFDLLAAIGRDCVGAVQIVPAGMEPGDVRRIDSEPMDVTEVARTLRGVTASGVLGLDDRSENFRISIAGAQEKTALLQLDGRWHRPLGATPTTHLLKLPLGLVGNMRVDLQESVENEWLCMRLLRELGLPAAHTEIAIFRDEVGEEKALAVERFDRVSVAASAGDAPTWIARLPQEDFCQATGTPGTRKYEAEGGPGIAQCLTLLANGERPQDDALAFAKTQLAFWLLAATDGHAKNFSIFLHRDGYVMTPLYDVLSAWPVIGKGPNKLPIQKVKLAMALRGKNVHYELRKITVRHWRILAEQTGVPDAFARMTEMVDRADPALDSVGAALPAGFPEVVWDRIAAGVRAQRDIFLKALAAGA